MIHGKENVSKLKKYLRKEYSGVESVELSAATLEGEVVDDVAILHDFDEMSAISLGGCAFGDWNSKKQIMDELKSWEKRPYKHLSLIVKDADLEQESDGRTTWGENWWDGPDWFVFS